MVNIVSQTIKDDDCVPVSSLFHGPGGITGLDVCARKVRTVSHKELLLLEVGHRVYNVFNCYYRPHMLCNRQQHAYSS
jgi:hypothetical protein